MKTQLLAVFALSFSIVSTSAGSAIAGGHSFGGGHHLESGCHGRLGPWFGFGGAAFGGGGDYGWDIAELYRQLYNNLPYFALHPPVYYSQPVPRTYGYSPFAYLPDGMTQDVVKESNPVTIVNPYVPAAPAAAEPKSDRAASTNS